MTDENDLIERQLEREDIFAGKVLHLVRDKVELPNGKTAYREICLHTGGVAVIPLTDDGMVIMERQFRYAHNRVFLEIPAGKLEEHETDPLEAAKRELKEETGAVAGKYTDLGCIETTPALINERIYVYLAEDLTFGECDRDEDEFLEVEFIPFDKLLDMVMRGEITDAKTQIAILKAARLKKLL